jgi:hypothetical protein
MAMQFKPQLAAMKLPQGDHLIRHHGDLLCCFLLSFFSSASPVLLLLLLLLLLLPNSLGREAAGCEGGTQLARTVISPLGTWKTTGWAEESHIATKYMPMVSAMHMMPNIMVSAMHLMTNIMHANDGSEGRASSI